ncbi:MULTISPECIES: copper ion binding protein [Paenibacillus]|uniref:copper ion binding protein n=1 Tax=Paenibacillus TaxID=44249 RepID=UPI000371453A|nr:copper ion binding protein [Paenibacillus massiliensis]
MSQVTLNVEGMSCNHCVQAVERAVKEAGAEAKVNLEAKTVLVDFDESKISIGEIKHAIEDQGYDIV